MGGVRAELELPLEHARRDARRRGARGGGDRAGARASAHLLDRRTDTLSGRRAAARGDRRGDGAPPRAAAARRAHLAARPGGGRRAGVAAAAPERGLGHGRGDGRAPARALPAGGRPRDRARGRRAWPATPPPREFLAWAADAAPALATPAARLFSLAGLRPAARVGAGGPRAGCAAPALAPRGARAAAAAAARAPAPAPAGARRCGSRSTTGPAVLRGLDLRAARRASAWR